jgi:hypothetical protein
VSFLVFVAELLQPPGGGKVKSAIAQPGQPTKKKTPLAAMPRGDGICFETTKKRVVSDAPMASCFMYFFPVQKLLFRT